MRVRDLCSSKVFFGGWVEKVDETTSTLEEVAPCRSMAMGRHWVALPSQRSMRGKLREAASGRAEAARILDEAPHDGRTRDHERKRRLAAGRRQPGTFLI